ncbi:MAG: hydrogenase maturation protease [Gammaproteobacteria bacterium]|nr:hydrogenase maturation protease [Gammaproteobacteria bacterium]
MSNFLILGIGNILLTDEGAGIHILNYLEQHFHLPAGIKLLDGGTLSFTLSPDLAAADQLVVVDAAHMGGPPGMVRTYLDGDFDAFIGKAKLSAHEVGLADLVDIARLTEHLPEHRALIGIQPQAMGWGERPTPVVEAALPIAANAIVDLYHRWCSTSDPIEPLQIREVATS